MEQLSEVYNEIYETYTMYKPYIMPFRNNNSEHREDSKH